MVTDNLCISNTFSKVIHQGLLRELSIHNIGGKQSAYAMEGGDRQRSSRVHAWTWMFNKFGVIWKQQCGD